MVTSSTQADLRSAGWQSLGQGVFCFADGVNTYLLSAGEDRAVVIDPGRGAWWPHLQAIGIQAVDAIVITHAHRDVLCGLHREGPLRTGFSGEVWLPSGDADFASPEPLQAFWNSYQSAGCPASYAAPREALPQRLRVVGADSEICIGPVRLCAVATPGHTRGALSYLYRQTLPGGERQLAFCGDAAHSGGTIHQPYHLEWDHWTPEGAMQAWYGLERLRGNRIDRLLPSHGSIIRRSPRQLLSKLQKRLLRLVSAKTAIAADEPSRWLDTEHIAEGVDLILPGLYAFGGNGYALASDDGQALIFDPQLADLPALERLLKTTGLTPDVATASHYHVDHSDGLDEIRQRFGGQVWLHPWVAEPLRDRNRLDVPWLTTASVVPDRLLPEKGVFRWHEFELGIRPYPGQTWWHCAIDTLVAGRRILFSGDNFQPPSRWNGTGGFCAFNGSRFREGFSRSASIGLQIEPDIVCNGHRCLYTFAPSHHQAILKWSKEAQAAVADVCPSRQWETDYDPRLIRCEPFVLNAVAGQTLNLDVAITNPTSTPLKICLMPQGTKQIRSLVARRRLTVKSRATRRVRIEMKLSRTLKAGRHIVGIDAEVNGVPRPEAAVALVDAARRNKAVGSRSGGKRR